VPNGDDQNVYLVVDDLGRFGRVRPDRHLSPQRIRTSRDVSAGVAREFRRRCDLQLRDEPALATSIDRVPSGERWIHEIKFDGYRVQIHLTNNGIKVFTRRDNDWTKRFKKIADDAWHINAGSALIDENLRPARNTDYGRRFLLQIPGSSYICNSGIAWTAPCAHWFSEFKFNQTCLAET
jgi:hypothetical protein